MPLYEVTAPDGKVFEVNTPEGASEQDAIDYIASQQSQQPQPEQDATAGPVEALVGGTKRFLSSGRTALEAPFSPEEAAVKGIERQQQITERPGASLEAVKDRYGQEGIWGAVKEVASQAPGAITEQAPFLASIAGGFRAGFALPVPPQLKPITGVGGALIAPFLVQAGSNIERQAEEQLKEGEDLDIALSKAYGTAAIQASLDVVSMRLGLSKLLGIKPAVLGTEGGEQLAKRLANQKLAKESLAKSTGIGAAKVAGAEVPTEIAQQFLERAQAGLPLTNDDAIKEYMEAGYAAGLLSPIGSVTRQFEKADANKLIKEQQERSNEIRTAFGKLSLAETRVAEEKEQKAKAKTEEDVKKAQQELEKLDQTLLAEAEEAAKTDINEKLKTREGTQDIILDVEESIKSKKPGRYFGNIIKVADKKRLLKDLQNRMKALEESYGQVFESVPEVTTDETFKSLGIGPSAKIRKSKQFFGLDVNNVQDNIKLRNALDAYLALPSISQKQEKAVTEYLESIPTVEQLEQQEIEDVGRPTVDEEGVGGGAGVPIQAELPGFATAEELGEDVGVPMESRVPSPGGDRRGEGVSDTTLVEEEGLPPATPAGQPASQLQPRVGTRPITPSAEPTFIQPPKKEKRIDKPSVPKSEADTETGGSGGSGGTFNEVQDQPNNYEGSKKQQRSKFLDWFETRFFSSNAALNNAIRRGMQQAGVPWAKMRDLLHKASDSQALHAENVAHQVLEKGGIEYDPVAMKFKAVEQDNAGWLKMVNKIREMGKNKGLSYEEAEAIANEYFEGRRLQAAIEKNKLVDQAIALAKQEKKPTKELEKQKVFIHLSDEEIQKRLDYVKEYPELQQVTDFWNNTRESLLKFAVDSGLYSQEQAQDLLEAIEYVPFYRIQEENQQFGPKEYSRGLLDFADPKRFRGSKRPVANIVDNMERWISYTVRRGIANNAAINLKNAALEFLPDEVRQVRKMTKGRSQNTIKIRENIVDEAGIEQNVENLYEFDDPLYIDAFTGLEAVLIPELKMMRPFTDFLRQSIVLNPLFSIGQLPQDAFGAMFTSGLKNPFAIPVEVMKEFFKTLSGTSTTREQLKPYGAVGQRDYTAFTNREDAKVAASMKKASLKDMMLRPFEAFANASDNAVRQAVYNRTLLETGGKRVGDKIVGGNKDAAIEKAFEIINFRRAGSSRLVSAGRQIIPFFGAYLQAMNVAAKTISGKGISAQEKNAALATLASTAAKVATLSLLYSMLVSDDEGYEKLDPVVRNRRLILPGTGGMSIPLRPDIFTFTTKIIPENIMQRMVYDGIDDRKFAKSLQDAAVNAIAGPVPFPQGIKPIFEGAINYNFFTGRPIVGMFEQQLETDLQYNQATSELARLLSDMSFDTISPKIIDHVIRGYTGYTGGLVMLATNDLIAAGYGRKRPEQSGQDFIASIPGMSMFVSREFGTRKQSDFYELRDEVMTAVASFNKLKANDPVRAKEYLEEKRDLLKLKTTVNKLSSSISKIRRESQRVIESDMAPQQKMKRLKELREMQEKLYSKAGILRDKAGF